MNKQQRQFKKNLKRKRKKQAQAKALLPLKIERQREKNPEYKKQKIAYKMYLQEKARELNLKLKKALGIPEDQEVETKKMIKAFNLKFGKKGKAINMDNIKDIVKEK